jgi:hypothetical protein
MYLVFAIGWTALLPLFDTFGLRGLSLIVAGLLLAAGVPSWALLSTLLVAFGHLQPRLVPVEMGLSVVMAGGYAGVRRLMGGPPDQQHSLLFLALAAYGLGALVMAVFATVPLLVDRSKLPLERQTIHAGITGLLELTLLAVNFLWLAAVGPL